MRRNVSFFSTCREWEGKAVFSVGILQNLQKNDRFSRLSRWAPFVIL